MRPWVGKTIVGMLHKKSRSFDELRDFLCETVKKL